MKNFKEQHEKLLKQKELINKSLLNSYKLIEEPVKISVDLCERELLVIKGHLEMHRAEHGDFYYSALTRINKAIEGIKLNETKT